MSGIDGDWHARKQNMNIGYTATWTVAAVDDENIVVSEKCGSHCCGCVPNCFPKAGCLAHRMKKEGHLVTFGVCLSPSAPLRTFISGASASGGPRCVPFTRITATIRGVYGTWSSVRQGREVPGNMPHPRTRAAYT